MIMSVFVHSNALSTRQIKDWLGANQKIILLITKECRNDCSPSTQPKLQNVPQRLREKSNMHQSVTSGSFHLFTRSKLKMRWNKHVLTDKRKLKWQETGLFHSMENKKRGRDFHVFRKRKNNETQKSWREDGVKGRSWAFPSRLWEVRVWRALKLRRLVTRHWPQVEREISRFSV